MSQREIETSAAEQAKKSFYLFNPCLHSFHVPMASKKKSSNEQGRERERRSETKTIFISVMLLFAK